MKYVPERKLCWVSGTGNGQISLELSKYFDKVDATDLSSQQIMHAEHRENIIYKAGRAEKTDFADHIFDLVTVAQAIYWFDIAAFNNEVKRVLKNSGFIVAWYYGLMEISAAIDQRIN